MTKPSATLPQKGLTTAQVQEKLKQFGTNEFEVKKEYSPVGLLLSQFASPLIYILMLAGIITYLLGDTIDAVVILLVVVSNSILGFWQEFKAAKSLEALKNYLKPKVVVIRDGVRQEILMSQLVPLDLVHLSSGSSVPADGLLIEAQQLLVNESLLTGESRSVAKQVTDNYQHWIETLEVPLPGHVEAKHAVYMGTAVVSGVGTMIVTKTGIHTQMGMIAKNLATTKEEATPLQKKFGQLAKNLLILVLSITLVVFAIGIIRGVEWLVMFETAVAMAVSAIPEGFSVSMTVILALGMQRIFKHKALVRKLVAVETLGSVTVICCDKTGTLTEGKMQIVGFDGNREDLIKAAIFANDERDEEGLAMRLWVEDELEHRKHPWTDKNQIEEVRNDSLRLSSIPFDSKHKYMASLNQQANQRVVYIVGAPEIVLELTDTAPKDKAVIEAMLKVKAGQGLRLIGVAKKTVDGQFELKHATTAGCTWVGALFFQDPLRSNVKRTLTQAQKAGVSVKIITGDYKETAVAILNEVFETKLIDSQIITGSELASMSNQDLRNKLDQVVLFARTTPADKLKIVQALKANQHVVAMTGDGVNDAPALKAADIGVVVNEATDVSKQTADMVLLDSNFQTIVTAIREGRVIFETMRKVLTYLLTDAFQGLFLIGAALLSGLPIPVTPAQILWINLVEDSFLSLALAFDAADDGVMKDKPRGLKGSILDGEMKAIIFAASFVSNVSLYVLYRYLLSENMDFVMVQTTMFFAMSMNSLLYIFSVKNLRKNIWQERWWDNKYLTIGAIVVFLLIIAPLYLPVLQTLLGTTQLSWEYLVSVSGLALVTLSMIELVKFVYLVTIRKKT